MLCLLAGILIALGMPAKAGPCPAGVVNQLDDLYRGLAQRMEQRVDRIKDLSSQRQRFTPSLFALLLQARKLEPIRDGRYLSFDVFSNTQVATFGAKVTGCSAQKAISLEAEVNVEVGLRNRPSGTPRRLLYEMSKTARAAGKSTTSPI